MSSEGPYSRYGAGGNSAGYSSASTAGYSQGYGGSVYGGYGGRSGASYSAPAPGEYGQQQPGYIPSAGNENYGTTPNQVIIQHVLRAKNF